jgi:hypothetical protein
MVLFLAIAVLLFAAYEAEKSVSTIAGYASKAGFTGADLAIAVAIAYAESGGRADAIGDLDLGVSVGLWQINLRAHPQYSQDELLDPQINANAAFAIYQAAGESFTPWTTFRSGKYQDYLSADNSDNSSDTPLIADESDEMGDAYGIGS